MFKKLLLVLIGVILSINMAWAAATVTDTVYGYSITGSNVATSIIADTWVTATAYIPDNKIIYSGLIYRCLIAHTSGTFDTNLAAGKWVALTYATFWANGIGQNAATATDKTTFTAGISGASSTRIASFAILNTDTKIFSGDGLELINPQVTLGASTDIIYIYTTNQNF